MYNRYIPQSDGSYQRNRVQDIGSSKPKPPVSPPTSVPSEPTGEFKPHPEKTVIQPLSHSQKAARPPVGISNFLRQLLPKNFDTADLLIILLLLLMAGDNEEEKSNALLTMALYFLM